MQFYIDQNCNISSLLQFMRMYVLIIHPLHVLVICCRDMFILTKSFTCIHMPSEMHIQNSMQ